MGCASSSEAQTVPVKTDEVAAGEEKLNESIGGKSKQNRRKSISEMSKNLLVGVLQRSRRKETEMNLKLAAPEDSGLSSVQE